MWVFVVFRSYSPIPFLYISLGLWVSSRMWLHGMIKLRATNPLCLIASYVCYWQNHPWKWIIYDHLYFSNLCHHIQKDQEPGRHVRTPSFLLVLNKSRPQLTESLCTALVLSLLPAVAEIIPCLPGGISGGAWKRLRHTAGWWSEREGEKTSSLGKKLQRVKLLTPNWTLLPH